ncbi:G-protein coupled receptor 20-like [Antennarius striatus]|uniref:G-protein coupled receptor 20-like n=1 Tax=Antennarius striatus TaxID=241820 RepID=UPI0035B08AA7
MDAIVPNVTSTSDALLPLMTPQPANCSAWDQRWGAQYHRLAHLDVQLYQDFYAVWVSLMVLNCLMLVVGVVLNSLALYVFSGASTHSSASVVYTMNLAVADLLVALSLPARIALYHSGGKCVACSYVHTFSYFVNMYCSILFLTRWVSGSDPSHPRLFGASSFLCDSSSALPLSICIDRYLAVVHTSGTLHRCRTTGTAKCVSATVWLVAVVVTYSFQTTALEFSSSCVLLPALFYLGILEFLLPLLAVVGFTLRLACFLSSRHGLAPQQSRVRRKRAVRLLATVLVVFTICFTPFHIRQVLVYLRVKFGREELENGAGHVLAYHITVSLSSLNSCLDPVVYCFVTDSFKRVWRTKRRGGAEEDGEAGPNGGGGAERNSLNKCSGMALVIAHSVATLTFTGAPLSLDRMDQSRTGDPPTTRMDGIIQKD